MEIVEKCVQDVFAEMLTEAKENWDVSKHRKRLATGAGADVVWHASTLDLQDT